MQPSLDNGGKPVVLAISGGVDSVVLLDLLAQNMEPEQLVVAHFDHGIREDSVDDARFVASLADRYGLRFVLERQELGPNASEAVARQARYDYLRGVKQQHDAAAIVTAHHQDDLIETAALNLLRGTGRRGISALKSTPDVWRPLLEFRKQDLIDYAQRHGLHWREDSTNQDPKYRRNYVRNVLIPAAEAKDPQFRTKMLNYINQIGELNQKADSLLDEWLDSHAITDNQFIKVKRHDMVMLSHAEAREVLHLILRRLKARDPDRKSLDRLAVSAKVGKPFSQHDICCHLNMSIAPDSQLIFGTRH